MINSFSLLSVVGSHRVVVLGVCVVIIVVLGIGSLWLKVTTSPVEIWANPNSRSRQEKDFYDNHFGPFYRTNQVFLKTRNIEKV